jgi:hypothetical protein
VREKGGGTRFRRRIRETREMMLQEEEEKVDGPGPSMFPRSMQDFLPVVAAVAGRAILSSVQ